MARLTKEEKKKFVEELSQKIKESRALVLSTYSGLTVEEMTELRNVIKELGAEVKVIKNTLMNLALTKAGYEAATSLLKGPIIYYFDNEDEIRVVKEVAKLSSKFEQVQFIGGVISGTVYNAEQMKQLSKIPTRQELMAKLVSSVYSPLYGFYYALQYNLSALVRALDAVKQNREK